VTYRPGMDVHALAELTLPDSEGRPQRLGDLWADRPALLVFARHFG